MPGWDGLAVLFRLPIMAFSNAEQSHAVRSARDLPVDYLPLVLNNVLGFLSKDGVRREERIVIVDNHSLLRKVLCQV